MRILVRILCGLLWLAGPAGAVDRVRLQLDDDARFRFAGYYMALERGLYQAEGLEVELLGGARAGPRPTDMLLNGKADFAVTDSGVVVEYLAGKPLIALAAILQSSPTVVLVPDDSDIATPKDLVGRRLATAAGLHGLASAEVMLALRREGVAAERVTLAPAASDFEVLLDGQVDAMVVDQSDEPFLLQQRGVGYRLIEPRLYGGDFYAGVLVTHAGLLERDPQRVHAFVRASLAGWRYALTHVDETIALIQRRYAPARSDAHLRFEAEQLAALIMPERIEIGHMNAGRWEFIARSHVDLGFAEGSAPINGMLPEPSPADEQRPSVWIAGGLLLLAVVAVAAGLRLQSLSRTLASEREARGQLERKLRESITALDKLAITDRLTGLWNRRKFEALAVIEIGRSRRYFTPLALIFLDIDHLKHINDQNGAATGDLVLTEVARMIRENVRQSDNVGRWGDGEFLILAPAASGEEAQHMAEKLRRMIGMYGFQAGHSITASIGVGILHAGDEWQQLMARADNALNRAKQAGGDRVQVDATAAEAIGRNSDA